MKFNSLPELIQISTAKAVVDFLKTAPKDLHLPDAPYETWLSTLKTLNVKLDRNNLPSQEEIWRAVEYIEQNSINLGFCPSCNS